MTYLRILSVLILGSLAFQSCAITGRTNERYFTKIKIDSRYSIVGHYPFDPATTPRTACYKITYDKQDRPILVQYLKAGRLGYGVLPYASVQTRISYHDDFELRESLNAAGKPVPFPTKSSGSDPSCIFSIRLDLNDDGERISLTNLNYDGKPFSDTADVVKYFWTLDQTGRIIKSIGINTDEDSVTDSNWERERHYLYDESGNLIEKRNIARSGKLCQTDTYNTAIIRMRYDASGNIAEKIHYDLFGNPSVSNFADTFMYRWDYNDWGQVIKIRQLEQDEEYDSIYTEKRSTRYEYDDRGNLTETRYLDAEGNTIIDSVHHVMQYIYDDRGNCVERIRCLEDGTPATLTLGGYRIQPVVKSVYDDDGLPIEDRFYNEENRLSIGYYPFATKSIAYTEFDGGWRIITSFYDHNGKPAPASPGISTVKVLTEIDKYGRWTLNASFDSLGNYDYPATHNTYDRLGNKIEEKYCDEKGRLKGSGYGALSKYEYNEYGYELFELVYDSLGNEHHSIDKYVPERPDNNCRDEEKLREYNEARAGVDSFRRSQLNQHK